MIKKWLLLLIFTSSLSRAVVTIQASSLSCMTPTILTTSTIIELDIPLIIDGTCSLITAGIGFGPTDTVTFEPIAANNITLTSFITTSPIGTITVINPTVWDVRSFNQSTQKFIFNDVIINMNPGATILADGVTFELRGASQLITTPIVPT